MMADKEELRDGFEAWIQKPPFERVFKRLSDESAWPGQYQPYEIELAWEAWQASAKQHNDFARRVREVAESLEEKAQEALAKAEAELTALRRALLKNWPDCILVDDDGQYESLLKEAGLIEPREVVEPCNKNECCCEPGDTCNFLTEKGRAALGGLNG